MISFSIYTSNLDLYLNNISKKLFDFKHDMKFHFSKSFHLQPFLRLYFHDLDLNYDGEVIISLKLLLEKSIQSKELPSFYDDLFLSRGKGVVILDAFSSFDEVIYGGEKLVSQTLDLLSCASIVLIQNLESKDISIIERFAIGLQLQLAVFLTFDVSIDEVHLKYSSLYDQLKQSSGSWVKKEDFDLIDTKFIASKDSIVDYIDSLITFFDKTNSDSYPLPDWVDKCVNLQSGLIEVFQKRELNFRGDFNHYHTTIGFNERIDIIIDKLLKEITHMAGVITVLDELEFLYYLKEGMKSYK